MSPDPERIVAVGLLSGGLDSALASRLVAAQGVEVIGYHLRTPFTAGDDGAARRARAIAGHLGIPCVVDDAGDEYIRLVREPRFGRGTAMNPCLDCHIFMVRRAAALAGEKGAAFVFTGEVLGQRPMSQRRSQLEMVEREAGLSGRLLRPLSARLLPPTEAEREGWVDRARLLDLQGRARRRQQELAAAWGITGYANPAGGCLLTDRNFGARLADAFAHGEDAPGELALLRVGRHFRLPSGAKVIVGRDEAENAVLAEHLAPGATAFEVLDVGSPVALLLRGSDADWPKAAALALAYSDRKGAADGRARIWDRTGEVGTAAVRAEDAAARDEWYVGPAPKKRP